MVSYCVVFMRNGDGTVIKPTANTMSIHKLMLTEG